MTETEIERMVVRLNGDASGFSKMLKDAQQQTKDAAKQIETQAKNIEGFGASIKKLGDDLKSGLVTFGLWTYVTKATDKATGELKKGLDELGNTFDTAINQTIEPVVKGLQEVTAYFKELPGWVKETTKTVAGLAAGAVGIAVLVSYGASLASTVKALAVAVQASPVTPWVAGIAAGVIVVDQLTKAINNNRESVRQLNKDLEYGSILNDLIAQKNVTGMNKQIKSIGELADAGERYRKYQELLKNASTTLAGAKEGLASAQRQMSETRGNFSSVTQVTGVGSFFQSLGNDLIAVQRIGQRQLDVLPELGVAQDRVTQATKNMAAAQTNYDRLLGLSSDETTRLIEQVDKLKERLKFDEQTRGMTDLERQFQRLADDAASVEGLFEKVPDLAGLKAAIQTKQLGDLLDQLKAENERLRGIDPRFKVLGQDGIDQAKAQQIRDQAAANVVQERENKLYQEAADLIKQYTDAVETFGMTQRDAQIFRFANKMGEGTQVDYLKDLNAELKELDRQQRLTEKGTQLAEAVRTPQEVLGDKVMELNQLLDEGKISWETYTRAMAAAEKQAQEVKSAINFSGALYGSAEAFRRIATYRDAMSKDRGASEIVDRLGRKQGRAPEFVGPSDKFIGPRLNPELAPTKEDAITVGPPEREFVGPNEPVGPQQVKLPNPYDPGIVNKGGGAGDAWVNEIKKVVAILLKIEDNTEDIADNTEDAVTIEAADFDD